MMFNSPGVLNVKGLFPIDPALINAVKRNVAEVTRTSATALKIKVVYVKRRSQSGILCSSLLAINQSYPRADLFFSASKFSVFSGVTELNSPFRHFRL